MGLKDYGIKQFHLLGDVAASSREIDIGVPRDMEDLRSGIGGEYTIVKPEGIAFHNSKTKVTLETLEDVLACEVPIAVTVDGNGVRTPPGAPLLPFVGNFYEIYPDHVQNYRRLFQKYGPVVKTQALGVTNHLTNDPWITDFVYRENHNLFNKQTSSANHPLYGLRDNASLFMCDSTAASFKLTHKFVPPAMSPKAVKHYVPIMQESVRKSFASFDYLDKAGLGVNVYMFMVKLAGQTLCKFILGHDAHHFDAPNSPLHPALGMLTQILELNRAVQTKGEWYTKLPFGPPRELLEVRVKLASLVDDMLDTCPRGGTEDLPLNDAALNAACLIDYLTRATDDKGEKLPHDLVLVNTLSVMGAGFTTISSLMSWLLYALMKYPGNQERLLQEIIDFDVTGEGPIDPDVPDRMPFLTNFINETLRLHSPSFQAARNALSDLILPGGYKIKKGDIVMPNFPATFVNPLYWKDPMRFDPDRWDTEEVKNRPKGLFTPFATGPRGCIGYNYALQQVKILLPSLVYRYHWELSSGDAVEYDPEFQIVRPLNIYARTIKRTEWPMRNKAAARAVPEPTAAAAAST